MTSDKYFQSNLYHANSHVTLSTTSTADCNIFTDISDNILDFKMVFFKSKPFLKKIHVKHDVIVSIV